ncbi:MAG: RHS repeat-associated core domain-containing protein, partial [Patescibacteria group bacterium]
RKIVLGTDTVVIPLGYDAGGRLISRASDTFAFDADGNQVTAVENGDETRYFWSNDNRLTRTEKDIECPKHGKRKCKKCPQIFTIAEAYGYAPESWKRITRKTGDETFVSLFDGDDESHEYTLETYKERDRKGKCEEKTKLKLIREFIGGPGTDDLVSTKYHGRMLEHLKDGLGSTIALTNRSGKAVTKIGYDAWGNMRWPDKPGHGVAPCGEKDLDDYLDRFEGGRSFENAGFDPWHLGRHHSRVLVPYLYTGRRFDAFSQLYGNRNRMLNPRVGRFISKDPISFDGGNNLWGYAGNNPIIYTDPFGLKVIFKGGDFALYQQARSLLEGSSFGKYLKLMDDFKWDIWVNIDPNYDFSIGGIRRGSWTPFIQNEDFINGFLKEESIRERNCGKELGEWTSSMGGVLTIFLGSRGKLPPHFSESNAAFVAHELLHEGLHALDFHEFIFSHHAIYQTQHGLRQELFNSNKLYDNSPGKKGVKKAPQLSDLDPFHSLDPVLSK